MRCANVPLKIRPGEEMTVWSQQIFTAENSAKRGDDSVPIFFLPLKIQPGEEMTVGLKFSGKKDDIGTFV